MKNTNEKQDHKMAESRKKQHIENFIKNGYTTENYFDDIILENNSLPELDFSEIDTSCIFLNRKIDYPIMINAITGGFDEAVKINKELALLANRFNIPMAVGSQSLGMKNLKNEAYKIVRDIMKDKLVIANVSANVSYHKVISAVEMINADAVQLHLNVPQEMCMKEGDRDFRGILKNIENILHNISVPVIIKEVGFGISKRTARQLFDVGIRYIDVGGKGGTNFIEIEDLRNEDMDFSDLYSWGIPTPVSLIHCTQISPELNIISSGGIKKAEDVVKSLCLGSKAVGITGMILRELVTNGYESSEKKLHHFLHKMKIIMLLVGSKNINELKDVNLFIKGDLKDLIS